MSKAYGEGIGFGKVILIGEHFVVYGLPAIAAGLRGLQTRLRVKPGKWNEDLDPVIKEALTRIARAIGYEQEYEIEVLAHVPYRQNLGSSAALSVAFVRALADLHSLQLSDEEVNKYAYEGEVVFHGTPSGIDNTAATFGTSFVFKKDPSGPTIERISCPQPLHILIVNCGEKRASTKELVEQVRALRKFPITESVFATYERLFSEFKKALGKSDLDYLGYLMDVNHGLLNAFGLSTSRIERARELLHELGALGSKITGAGGGGNIIALFPTGELAGKARKVMEENGFPCFYSEIR